MEIKLKTNKSIYFYNNIVTNPKIIRIIAKNSIMIVEFLKSIPPPVWVLIAMIGLPFIVFGTIHLSAHGFFERFKRKKK